MSNTYCAMALGFLCTTMIIGMENEHRVYTSDDLFQAIKVKDCAAVKTIVMQQPALVNEHHQYSDNRFMAPLHYAVQAEKKCCKVVQLLIDAGARCNEPMQYRKYTPLHVSLLELDLGDQSQQKNLIKLLVQRGANVEQKDKKGRTPLYMLLADRRTDGFERALYLLKYGADINAQDNKGNSLLHNAECRSFIEWLLDRGAEPMVQNKKGVFPFEDFRLWPPFSGNPFEKVGIVFFPSADSSNYNPLLLLKNDAAQFKRIVNDGSHIKTYRHSVINRLAQLFTVLNTHGSCYGNCTMRGIITNRRGMLFNKACMSDLEELVGAAAIRYVDDTIMGRCRTVLKNIDRGYDFCIQEIKKYPYVVHYCPQQAFELFRHAIKQKDNRFLRFLLDLPRDHSLVIKNYSPNLMFTYSDGDTLLHVAVMESNPLAIELLIANEVDFTAINIQSATAFDMAYYLKNEACIEAFYKAICKKLFSIPVHSLFYKRVKDFLKKTTKDGRFDINWRDEKGKTLLHHSSYSCRTRWCKNFLKMGARVNIPDNKGNLPLLVLVKRFLLDFVIIHLFLEHDALITKDMMQIAQKFDKKLLHRMQNIYDEQQCCVCYEHCQEMNNIPCKNYHQGTFICKDCCSQVKNNTNACPCCRENMGEYGT